MHNISIVVKRIPSETADRHSTMLFLLLSALLAIILPAICVCPNQENIVPCICKDLGDGPMMMCSNLTSAEELISPVKGTESFKMFSLMMINSALLYIPSSVFMNTVFKRIRFANSQIMSLSDGDLAFVGLEDHLEEIRASDAHYITQWDWSQLKNLRRLDLIDIVDIAMYSVDQEMPALQSLTSLGISKAEISFVHPSAFSKLKNLVRLSLANNEITEMSRTMLPDPASALSVIDLRIITHILKKNMQITENHQMARIVRHNDESGREGYIRNGGKEVKLFTSALKAFQCNNRIVMAQRKHLDDFLRGRIIGRLECGRTQLEVSEKLGIAQSVISRLWQRFQDDGNVSRCYSSGRPRVTTPNEDRYLAVTAKRNRRSTASDLSRQLSSATGTTVSRQTVYRRLGHIGLYARRPVRCVPLTATHCRLRLAWSREHALRTPQQWSCVMFSDESRFSLQSDSRRTFIWRAPGTRYHQENTIERHRYGGAGWLVWRGIILGSRTDLHVQSVTMTGHIYRDVILEQHVRLFRGAMVAEFLFMDDNARPHRANIVDECLQSEDITRMDWPAYSPDVNPIEHVWDMLGRRIAARQPPPTYLPELRRALLDEWCNIPQDQIDNLILSMPRRCKACISSSGSHTPY
ncbi:Transposable element Tcb1 transposase [Araneus ventricosus]|uniref:Transposable element Tcb1 transposase n=1 Tax=Araneus ventricosus TaxID=182803 RepID=A0A4Y2EJI7_ARAVE|nr:Transposable element Tcb1 transposase [Araneus ventricosus]